MGPAARRRLCAGRPRCTAGARLIPGPTTFHLVRHAEHGLLPHTLAGRMPGVPLSPSGRYQATRLAAHFVDCTIAAIISSPVQRALETAAPIADALNLELRTDPGFDEIDFGDWTGRSFAELETDPAWLVWNSLRAFAAPPRGEAMHHAQSRALTALHRWRLAYSGRDVIVVSHSDVIKSLLAPGLGLSLDRLYRLTVEPGTISTLVLFDQDLRIDRINAKA